MTTTAKTFVRLTAAAVVAAVASTGGAAAAFADDLPHDHAVVAEATTSGDSLEQTDATPTASQEVASRPEVGDVGTSDEAAVEPEREGGAATSSSADAEPTSEPAATRRAPLTQAPAPTPSASPAPVITNPAADAVKVAWVDDDRGSTAPAALPYTLQQALATAAATGGIVHVADGELGFTKALSVNRSVTVTSAHGTHITALWSVTADDVTLTQDPTVTLAGTAVNGRSVVTTAKARTTLRGIRIVPNGSTTGTTGLNLNASTGVTVDGYRFDGGTSGGYGISARAANAVTVRDATITGASLGYFMHGSETVAVGPRLTDVSITAYGAYGVQLGNAAGASFDRIDVVGTGGLTTVNSGAIDLGTTQGARISDADLRGFGYGVKSTATGGRGLTLEDATIRAAVIGVSLGTTADATISRTALTGPGGTATTVIGVEGAFSTGVTLTDVTIDGFPTGYRTRAASGAGTSLTDVTITGAVHNGVALGSTDGNDLTNVRVTGAGAAATAVAVHLGGSEHVTIDTLEVTGMPTGVGSSGVNSAGPAKTGVTVEHARFTDVTSGISLSNYRTIVIDDVTVATDAPKGSGVYLRETAGSRISHLDVRGTLGTTYSNGTNGIRTYYTEDVTVTDVTIDTGSTGFYWDMTTGVSVTGAEVMNMSWYGTYSENVLGWRMTGSSFHDNEGIANLTINPTDSSYDPRNERTTSSAVRFTDNTFTDNRRGIYLPLGFGGMEFDHNVVEGVQEYVILAAPAHNVSVHDNAIAFTGTSETSGAISVGHDVHKNLDTDDPTSSGIRVVDNTFTGAGPFLRVGSPLGTATALSDTIRVQGNTFPADSVAIDARTNAGPGDGPAVDARDYDDPNDFGSVCRSTSSVGPAVVYDGEGAAIRQVAAGQVLYPRNCIDLSLVESALPSRDHRAGDTVSWTLTPHNEGLVEAPAGWSVTQLLPDGVELVAMSGEGYAVDGLVATATHALAPGTDGPAVTVTVRITAPRWSADEHARTLTNVAYVAPLAPADSVDLDGDGFVDVVVEHHHPLVVPTLATDTSQSATNNDTQGSFTVVRGKSTLVVRHVRADALLTEVCASVTTQDYPGAGYTTERCFPDGLELVRTSAGTSGHYPAEGETLHVTYYYAPTDPLVPDPGPTPDPTTDPTTDPRPPAPPLGPRDPEVPAVPRTPGTGRPADPTPSRLASTGATGGALGALAAALALGGTALVVVRRRGTQQES